MLNFLSLGINCKDINENLSFLYVCINCSVRVVCVKVFYIVLSHCMVYHVPTMLKKYGNLRQFSGKGMFHY